MRKIPDSFQKILEKVDLFYFHQTIDTNYKNIILLLLPLIYISYAPLENPGVVFQPI